jgi:hypothetical protein
VQLGGISRDEALGRARQLCSPEETIREAIVCRASAGWPERCCQLCFVAAASVLILSLGLFYVAIGTGRHPVLVLVALGLLAVATGLMGTIAAVQNRQMTAKALVITSKRIFLVYLGDPTDPQSSLVREFPLNMSLPKLPGNSLYRSTEFGETLYINPVEFKRLRLANTAKSTANTSQNCVLRDSDLLLGSGFGEDPA